MCHSSPVDTAVLQGPQPLNLDKMGGTLTKILSTGSLFYVLIVPQWRIQSLSLGGVLPALMAFLPSVISSLFIQSDSPKAISPPQSYPRQGNFSVNVSLQNLTSHWLGVTQVVTSPWDIGTFDYSVRVMNNHLGQLWLVNYRDNVFIYKGLIKLSQGEGCLRYPWYLGNKPDFIGRL